MIKENKIDKQNVEDMIGLTAMQAGMLFHYLTNPLSLMYMEQIRLVLSGKIDNQQFKEAWKILADTNEMLRSVFAWEKLEEPVQIVLKQKEVPIRVFDLSARDKQTQKTSQQTIIENDKNQPLDLTREPFRITLFRCHDHESLMILTFHHILLDGWSTGILLNEFQVTYNQLANGETSLPTSKTRYKEFIKWYQQSQLRNVRERREFWKNYLEGFDTRTLLPYNKKKLHDIQRVSTHKIEISSSWGKKLWACAQSHNVTISTILYVTWGILLQRYNNSDDIVFGSTVSGRTPLIKGIEQIVGLFINTLPLRLNVGKGTIVSQTFYAIDNHLKERSVNGFEHNSLTEIIQLTSVGKESNLFDSIIVIDNYPLDNLLTRHTPGSHLLFRSYGTFEMTNFDLTVQVMMLAAGQMRVDFHYDADLFESGTIQRMAAHFINILQSMISDTSVRTADLPMLTAEETRQILEEFNNPVVELLVKQTIDGVISDQAVRTPFNNAVQFEDRCLTYQELNKQANRLAHMLREYSVNAGCDSRVAVMYPRSLEVIIALLGILKTGAACIPLDISYPEERNRFIIRDSESRFLLRPAASMASIPSPIGAMDIGASSGVTEIFYDVEKLKIYPGENPGNPPDPAGLSFIIYTSGSTGKPKGALLHHSGIVNHTYTKIQVLGITETDTVANNFSINVIASVWQILSPLFTGCRLVLYQEAIEWDPYLQFQRVEADGVTVIEVIPSLLKAYLFLLDEGKEKIKLKSLRKIALTSEETKPFLVNNFYEKYTHIDLVDCYGQTECCDDVLHYTIPVDTNTRVVPIGTPSLKTNIFILNHHDRLQPVGVAGEICVVGAGVGYGYWKRSELTGEKFIEFDKGAFSQIKNIGSNNYLVRRRLYKTGDLGRWLADGKVEYLGRVDQQVKIRGNRVELREIENQVLRYPAVKEAVVVVKEDHEGEKALYTFLVSYKEIIASEIRQFLLKTLPDYMVPAHFVPMEELPHTPNGKVDRKVLLKIEIKSSLASSVQYIPPTNQYESKIREIWMQLLDRDNEQLGIHDNFFDLGGHSLMLIKLKNKLEKTFNHEVGILELFNYPTIAHQARLIMEKTNIGDKDMILPGEHREEKDMKPIETAKKDYRDIAVIGISLSVPGADHIDEFWKNLIEGTESISFFKEEELEYSRATRLIQGDSKLIPAGGVLGDVDLFDAEFFNINPGEAEIMDPQQRLFLEHAWKALEDAGYVGETYPVSIGVYAGSGWNIYLLNNVLSNTDIIKSRGEFHTMIANDKDFLATRVSYKLNLKGPALTVQTACSTSLTAVHLAKQGLLNGECDMALAGGVAVKVPERTGYVYTEGIHLSPDGHCRPFDAEARGTVFGSGIGIVVLKRLAEAVTDNDQIYAVIKGSAINNDGSLKVGYTSPGEIGQSEVILKAMKESGVHPVTIEYIETHGTGTSLGDPVEIAALTRAFATFYTNTSIPAADKLKEKKQYCAVGSVKANLGHLDVAAGVVGFIKACLCLKYKQIPPSINCQHPNPLIDFDNSPFFVNRTLKDWSESNSKTGTPRRASVSALGIGGTNAHVILEEAPQSVTGHSSLANDKSRDYQLIVLSAKIEPVLEKMTKNLAEYFKKKPMINLADAAYTLQVGRKAFPHRRVLVCSDVMEAIEDLSNKTPEKVQSHHLDEEEGDRNVAFMFSGQGSQYVNMGLELYQTEPVFRKEMDRCFEILNGLLDYDIKEILYPRHRSNNSHKSHINQTKIAQPLLFAFEYALTKLLIKWGIKPYAMIGHSIGEYVAACLAGVFSLDNALSLVVSRGMMMQQMPHGSMLGVPLPEKELTSLLNNEIALAAVNSPSNCVVSGPFAAIDAFEKQLAQKGVKTTRLHTSHAFHSKMMNPVLKDFETRIKEIELNKPQIPYISNLSGNWITDSQATDPRYWTKHTRQTVRFADGINVLLDKKNSIFIEVGPSRMLSSLVKKSIRDHQTQMAFNLVRHPQEKVSDLNFLVNKIGQLWLCGVEIDWQEFHAVEKRSRVSLPAYPFERRSYWARENMAKLESADLEAEQKHFTSVPVKNKNISKWFYVPSWKPSGLNPASVAQFEEKPTWLVFIDKCAFSAKLIQQLVQSEHHIITVRPGPGFIKEDDNSFTINPGESRDYEGLIEELSASGRLTQKIVHLWNISQGDDGAQGIEGFEKYQDLGFFSLLFLAQAIGKKDFNHNFHITVLTNSMFDVTGVGMVYPEKTTLLGPIKVIPQEYPQIRCRSIDIDLPAPGSWQEKKLVDRLVGDLVKGNDEPVVAYRGNLCLVQSYEPVQSEINEPGSPKLKKDGVYLITGGLGKIGLTVAEHLAKNWQAKLILTGRSPFPVREQWETWLETYGPGDEISSKIHKVMQMESLGSEVIVAQGDVTHLQEMERIFKAIEKQFGKPDGIIHAAGTTIEESTISIQEITRQNCLQVFEPKVSGLWVLEKILKGKQTDFCLVFSSLSSILGGIGFAAYSAANIYMDEFVQRKNYTSSTHWVTINWDLWKFAAQDKQKNKPGGPGANLLELAIEPGEGLEALEHILSQDDANQFIVSTGELNPRIEKWIKLEVPGDDYKITQKRNELDSPASPRPVLPIQYVPPGNDFEKMVVKIWEDYFGIKGIGIHDNFFDLGATSLDLIRLNDRLKKIFKKDLSTKNLFTYPTIHALAGYLEHKESVSGIDDEEMDRANAVIKGKKRLKRKKMSIREGPDD